MEGRRFRAYGYRVRAHGVELKHLISVVRQCNNVTDHSLKRNACALGVGRWHAHLSSRQGALLLGGHDRRPVVTERACRRFVDPGDDADLRSIEA